MKNLFQYIEEMEGAATPGNTVGMGNPMLPTAEEPGTEPLCATAKCKKEKKKKVKESLLDDEDDLVNANPDTIYIKEVAKWIKDNNSNQKPIEWIEKHLSYAEKGKKHLGLVWNDDFDNDADEFLDLTIDGNKVPHKFESICGSLKITFPKAATIDFSDFPFYFHGGTTGKLIIVAKKATKLINTNQLPLVAQHVTLDMPKLKDLNYDPACDAYSLDIHKCTSLETITSLPVISGNSKSRKIILPNSFVNALLKNYFGYKVNPSTQIEVKK